MRLGGSLRKLANLIIRLEKKLSSQEEEAKGMSAFFSTKEGEWQDVIKKANKHKKNKVRGVESKSSKVGSGSDPIKGKNPKAGGSVAGKSTGTSAAKKVKEVPRKIKEMRKLEDGSIVATYHEEPAKAVEIIKE